MFELDSTTTETPMIDFGMNGKVLFQLPVLGQKGVPVGVMSAFAIFYDKVQSGRRMTEQEVSSAWGYFIQTLADSYPDATRQLSRLDEDQLKAVIAHWVQKSGEIGGFDPKEA
ncbi:MAG: hypothetical protein R2732_05415 [Microbacteriaceae bacterium]